jgi:hypothetical protein
MNVAGTEVDAMIKSRCMCALLLAVVAGAVLPHSSSAGPEQGWSLVGTWINPTYETTEGYSARVVYNQDGTWAVYKMIGDKTPASTGTFTVTKDWTEAGVHWFQVIGTYLGTTVYELDKVTNDGTIFESTASTTWYPAAIDPAAGFMTTLRFRMSARQ